MSVFNTKKDVKLFLCQKSVEDMKPFQLCKSEPGRIVVKCTKKPCAFKMVFHGNDRGVFIVIEQQQHNCSSELPTIKRVWIRQIAGEMKGQKVTSYGLKEHIKDKFGVDVDLTLIKNALADGKRTGDDNRAFGFVSSFLDSLAKLNEGTTTCLISKEWVFQRAFLCHGMCVRAFEHTTKIVGLDACHIKAWYGGVLLVMTVLDGNGQIFPVALGIAESENPGTWSWFLWLVQWVHHNSAKAQFRQL